MADMKKDKLLQYCKDQKIATFKEMNIDQLNAAIVRASLHKSPIERKADKTCFGFWEHENSICATCDFEKPCFQVGFGMTKEVYEKKLENLENPRLSFVGKMSKVKKTRF